jgi:hypothetical protein
MYTTLYFCSVISVDVLLIDVSYDEDFAQFGMWLRETKKKKYIIFALRREHWKYNREEKLSL